MQGGAPEGHGSLNFLSFDAIQKILDCLGLPSRPPPIANALPAREIDELDFS
jgi:hypothetical protein